MPCRQTITAGSIFPVGMHDDKVYSNVLHHQVMLSCIDSSGMHIDKVYAVTAPSLRHAQLYKLITVECERTYAI